MLWTEHLYDTSMDWYEPIYLPSAAIGDPRLKPRHLSLDTSSMGWMRLLQTASIRLFLKLVCPFCARLVMSPKSAEDRQ